MIEVTERGHSPVRNSDGAETPPALGGSTPSMSQFDAAAYESNEYDQPYHDPEVLRELYWGEELTTNDLADIFDVYRSTIVRAMQRAGVPRRDMSDYDPDEYTAAAQKARRVERAELRLSQRGYEYWRSHNGETEDTVKVHRLLMTLAVDDLDELDGKDVHHRNGVKWDNRLENLELMTPAEHRRHHAAQQRDEQTGRFA